jgi:DNA-binding MarR family transcriptional regulator
VARVQHPTDRRTTLCEITPAGEKLVATATDAITGAEFGIAGLTSHDVDTLIDLLAAFRHASGDFER